MRRRSSAPPSAPSHELAPLLVGLEGRPWIHRLEITTQRPPRVFRAAAEGERLARIPLPPETVYVHVVWEPDPEGLRCDYVDGMLAAARARAAELTTQRALASAIADGRRARHARIDLEMELGAANAIADASVAKASVADARTREAEQLFLDRDRLATASAMFASAAHDIRSPLTVLVCNLRVLEEHAVATGIASSPEVAGVFEDTKLACDLIEGVLEGMRTFGASTGGPRLLDVRQLVTSTIRLFRWHMSQRGVRLEYQVEGDPKGWGTPSETCQVLLNLLANAAEASPRGGVVRLDARSTGDGVCIRVTDDGPGIAAQDREQVFAPFHSTKESGLGVGLTVARTMARHHGGDVRVGAAEAARGATLELHLRSTPPTE